MRHAFTMLLAVIAVALGLGISRAQDTPPAAKPDPSVSLLKLYRTAGASWSYRIVSWHREGGASSSSESLRVESVTDGVARLATSGRSFSGDSVWRSSASQVLEAPNAEHLAWAAAGLPEETLNLGFASFACKKVQRKDAGQQVTTWVSTEFHPLVVKQVTLSAQAAEVRTLTAFQAAEVDPWLLYRVVGRSWTVRTTVTVPGADPMVSGYMQTVTALEADSATVSMQMLDQDLKPLAGIEPTESRMELRSAAPAEGAPKPEVAAQPAPTTREKLKTPAGEFDCQRTEYGASKIWMATTWPSLPVRIEAQNMVSELVAFDLGHDHGRFYRKAGNSWTLRSTTEAGAMRSVSLSRTSVLASADGTATLQMTSLDANGREIARNEFKSKILEATSPLLPYAGQQEELVNTPAGNFPAVVQELRPGHRVWTWHGIVVRQEMKTDDISLLVELTELKLE